MKRHVISDTQCGIIRIYGMHKLCHNSIFNNIQYWSANNVNNYKVFCYIYDTRLSYAYTISSDFGLVVRSACTYGMSLFISDTTASYLCSGSNAHALISVSRTEENSSSSSASRCCTMLAILYAGFMLTIHMYSACSFGDVTLTIFARGLPGVSGLRNVYLSLRIVCDQWFDIILN